MLYSGQAVISQPKGTLNAHVGIERINPIAHQNSPYRYGWGKYVVVVERKEGGSELAAKDELLSEMTSLKVGGDTTEQAQEGIKSGHGSLSLDHPSVQSTVLRLYSGSVAQKTGSKGKSEG